MLYPGPSPYTQLLNWQVFKQPQHCRQAQEFIKIFSASAFPRKESEMRGRRRRARGGWARRLGNQGADLAQRQDRATTLPAFIPLSLSLYLSISLLPFSTALFPLFFFMWRTSDCGGGQANNRQGVACWGLGSWDNSNRPSHCHPCLPHTNCWHFNSFDTYFKGCSASELY